MSAIAGRLNEFVHLGATFSQVSPQVHMHHWHTDEEVEEQKFGSIEICCHGCGNSIVILFNIVDRSKETIFEYVDSTRMNFEERHMKCRNFEYENRCPNMRAFTKFIDLRIDE